MSDHEELSLFPDDRPVPAPFVDRCPCCGQPKRPMDAPGKVARVGPDTSRRAAALPRFGSQRWRVLAVLASAEDATAAEVAAQVGMSRDQTATRLGELRDCGFVEYVEGVDGHLVEREVGPGSTGLVQRITRLGAAYLRDNERPEETPTAT